MCNGACVNLKTDSANCGVCGHDCLGGLCQAGECQPVKLASGQGQTVGIALDATHVYWTSSNNGTVTKVSKGGGTPTTLASGISAPFGIAVDSTSVYWVANSGGNVYKAPIGGGNSTILASAQGGPLNIAVDATNVYWTNTTGSIMEVPIAGGSPVVIATGQTPLGLAIDANYVYWVNGYFGSSNATVNKVPKGGGVPIVLVSGQTRPTAISVDSTNFYWASLLFNGADTLQKCPLSGCPGNIPVVLASNLQIAGLSNLILIAVDATNVYWPNGAEGTIKRVSINGGVPKTVAPQDVPAFLDLDPEGFLVQDRHGVSAGGHRFDLRGRLAHDALVVAARVADGADAQQQDQERHGNHHLEQGHSCLWPGTQGRPSRDSGC
jgi:hypothetical protein